MEESDSNEKCFNVENADEEQENDDDDDYQEDEEEEDEEEDDEVDDTQENLDLDDTKISAWKYRSSYENDIYIDGIKQLLKQHRPVCNANALVLNKEMQAQLVTVRDNVQRLLQHIQKVYDENEDRLKNGMKYKRRGMGIRGAYLQGGTFYFKGNMFFKDVNCRNCPNNPDYTYRSEVQHEMFPMDYELRGRHVWSVMDKFGIVRGIKEQAIEYLERKQKKPKTKNRRDKDIKLYTRKLSALLPQIDDGFEIDWNLIGMHTLKHRHTPSSCEAMWNVYLKPSLKRGGWSKEENAVLITAAKRYNFENWQAIADEVGHRSDYQCFVQFQTTVAFMLRTKWVKWTPQEDARLLHLISTYSQNGVINWNAVSARFPQRSKSRAMSRYMYTLNPQISHAPFTPQEDLTLLAAVKEYGENFSCIPRTFFPNRTSVQLRSRYKNTLMHRSKHQGWTKADDQLLMDFVAKHGQSSWVKCAELLPTHTRTGCRTRFLTIKNFLEKNPNATVDDLPRKFRCPSNSITTDNWAEKIIELRNNPNATLLIHKRRPKRIWKQIDKDKQTAKRAAERERRAAEKPPTPPPPTPPEPVVKPPRIPYVRKKSPYIKRIRSIELRMYNYFKYAYNFRIAVNPCNAPPQTPHTLQLVQAACGFQARPNFYFRIDRPTLPNNVAEHCHAVLSKCSTESLAESPLMGFTLPPNWSSLCGFRAMCVLSAQVQTADATAAKQTTNLVAAKVENTEAVQLLRQRLRTLFYKTGLLSRLHPNNIGDMATGLQNQMASIGEGETTTTEASIAEVQSLMGKSTDYRKRPRKRKTDKVSKNLKQEKIPQPEATTPKRPKVECVTGEEYIADIKQDPADKAMIVVDPFAGNIRIKSDPHEEFIDIS